MSEPLPQEHIQTTTWFQRNKSWAIPVGCIGLVVVLGCSGVLGAAAFCAKKGSELYNIEQARIAQLQADVKQKVEANPAVQEALGTPVAVGEFQNRGYNNMNGNVRVEFAFRATGPKGVGDGICVATREGPQGDWSYERLELDVNGQIIALTRPR